MFSHWREVTVASGCPEQEWVTNLHGVASCWRFFAVTPACSVEITIAAECASGTEPFPTSCRGVALLGNDDQGLRACSCSADQAQLPDSRQLGCRTAADFADLGCDSVRGPSGPSHQFSSWSRSWCYRAHCFACSTRLHEPSGPRRATSGGSSTERPSREPFGVDSLQRQRVLSPRSSSQPFPIRSHGMHASCGQFCLAGQAFAAQPASRHNNDACIFHGIEVVTSLDVSLLCARDPRPAVAC